MKARSFLLITLAAVSMAACESSPQTTAAPLHPSLVPDVVVSCPHDWDAPQLPDALYTPRDSQGLEPWEFAHVHANREDDELYTIAANGETNKLRQKMKQYSIQPGQRLLHQACVAGNEKTLRWAIAQGCKVETGQNYWGSIVSGDNFKGCDHTPGMLDHAVLPLVRILLKNNAALAQEESTSYFLQACDILEMPQTQACLEQHGAANTRN